MSLNKMKLAGKVANKPVDNIFDVVVDKDFSKKHVPDKEFVDIKKVDRKLKKWLISSGKAVKNGHNLDVIVPKNVSDQIMPIYQDMAKRFGKDIIMEFSDAGFRVRKKIIDTHEPLVEFQDLVVAKREGYSDKVIIETAEDDRVIGIPYTIANVGADKYYVINGRVYSGWAMWYGLQAIRSPEDYAKNVDLTYNVPFVWAGFKLKALLSLGASFDISHGTEEEETPEENLLNEIFFKKLKIGVNKLLKTSMHLDMYGNAYWHIRRDNNGFPDKITILMPERIKVFLDPKTTKVLYYIYLPPILAGMALTPYPNIRENPNVLHGPALTYPTPIVIDPHNIIHFKENDVTEYPFGLSNCKSMIDPCTARMDINILSPMIFKKYAKPLIHWRLDPMLPFQLTKGQIEAYINGFKDTLESMEPMSDPVTSIRWSAAPIGAAQGKAELLTILQDLDNQIFSSVGVPQSYFKPQGMTDRMISEQDKTMLADMQLRQQMVGDHINEMLIRPIIDRYDKIINENLAKSGAELLPPRKWNDYPTLRWRETFKQDQVTTIQNTLALLQAGIIDAGRAARRVGEKPPATSEDLSRQRDLNKISEEVQIKQAQLQMLQTELEMMRTMAVIQNGGVEPGEEEAESGSEGGNYKEPKKEDTSEDQLLRVTFVNRNGKNQTEVMKASTLKKQRAAGVTIKNIEPVANTAENPAQKNAKKALGD